MTDPLIRTMQLIGSLMALALGTTALVWYVVLWPFDRKLRWT